MRSDGSSFYDDEAQFQTYMQHLHRSENPNDTIEKPILVELIGDPRWKRVLDLGCGDAALGVELLEQGAQSYTCIEGSQKMVTLAQKALEGTRSEIICTSMENWKYPETAFDLVVSRLALHYVEHLEEVFQKVHDSLSPGGLFVFSVEHPVITSSDRSRPETGPRKDWIVDNYFETGLRISPWLGSEVAKYHRTVEDYFHMLQEAGFSVESLRESRPNRANFATEETYQRRKRIPLYLFMAARKGK